LVELFASCSRLFDESYKEWKFGKQWKNFGRYVIFQLIRKKRIPYNERQALYSTTITKMRHF